jgi:hypothetical protein
MDVTTSVRSYPLQDEMDNQGCIHNIFRKVELYYYVRTHLVVYIFIRSCFVVKF